MHRLPSSSSLIRFRLASILLVLVALAIPAGLVQLGRGAFLQQQPLVIQGFGILVLGLVLAVVQWFIASRARCPLCMVPPLSRKSCQKNRKARRLFGSYRLRVAVSVLARNRFQCPYCGEPTRMAVRERSSGR